MKYIILIILGILFFSCAVQNIPNTERKEIQYQLSTNDFINNTPSDIGYTQIKDKGYDFIRIDGFLIR